MWQSNAKLSIAKRGVGNGLVAVAIDKDRGSQHAIRWTIDNLLTRGNTIILIHVLKRAPSSRNYFLSFFQILDLTILPIHALAFESIAYYVISAYNSNFGHWNRGWMQEYDRNEIGIAIN